MESLTEYYNNMLKTGELLANKKQQRAIVQLQDVQNKITQSQCLNNTFLQKLFSFKKPSTIKGAYLYGGVGGGKSLLMDLFYKTLNCPNKHRVHYHSFMEWAHHTLSEQVHDKYPVNALADKLAKKARIICIDEFHVNNITDAMIMKSLMEALYKRQILLVFTSNRPPEELYYNGLQRESFLPAIDLIQDYNITINVENDFDYRQKKEGQKDIFKVVSGIKEKTFMNYWVHKLCTNTPLTVDPLPVSGRLWPVYGRDPKTLWVDFSQCCEETQSRQDYLQLAKQFDTILISNIKRMDDESNDQARRFINLIDALYDEKVHLVATADVPFDCLYQGEFLAFVFERTTSRLKEIQGKDYWESKEIHRNESKI
jgi:cell division protein ZapE